jgi:hypothetical protein
MTHRLEPVFIWPPLVGLGVLLTLAGLFGCAEPVTPGTDLVDPAPEAVLGTPPAPAVPAPDGTPPAPGDAVTAQLDGEYAVAGSLMNPLGDPIAVDFTGVVTQEGAIEEGDARIHLEVRSKDGDGPPASFAEPVAVSPNGAFAGTVVDLLVSGDFSDLLAADVNTDLIFDARILDDDCFSGNLGLQLKEAQVTGFEGPISIRLDGTFTAVRDGAECDFPSAEDTPSDDMTDEEGGDA